jgi:hypothetical protein
MPLGLELSVQLAVVDSLIAMLAQWWTGVTLLQTVYTSLYMLSQQELTKDPYLKAACSIVTAIVSISKFIIYQSMVVEVRTQQDTARQCSSGNPLPSMTWCVGWLCPTQTHHENLTTISTTCSKAM